MVISRPQYMKGMQCHKALWYSIFKKDLTPPPASNNSNGNNPLNKEDVIQFAKLLFPKSVKVTERYYDIEKAVKSTNEYIAQGHESIFEASAKNPANNTYSRIDLLQKSKNTDKWEMIDIKASPSAKESYLNDMAFKYHIFSAAGCRIERCLLMLINKDYIKKGGIEPTLFFKLRDVSEEIDGRQPYIEKRIEELHNILEKPDEPDVKIGGRCFYPFKCDYMYHCWAEQKPYNIYNIFKKDKADRIFNKIGSTDIDKLPVRLYPEGKRIDIICHIEEREHIDKQRIRYFLMKAVYPLYFLDYETLMPTVPLFDGTRPFQQIPYQFSLHIQEEEGAPLKHFEFIHKERSDPREPFIKNLIETCGTDGTIVIYNQSFEEGVNKKLAEEFPVYEDRLIAINKRMIDIFKPFKSRHIYSSRQSGSASIKNVLPAFTDLSYKEMEIGNGQEAMDRYMAFMTGSVPENDLDKLWNELSEYCKLDTYAMVKLLEVLRVRV